MQAFEIVRLGVLCALLGVLVLALPEVRVDNVHQRIMRFF
jgi:hypothetical protein